MIFLWFGVGLILFAIFLLRRLDARDGLSMFVFVLTVIASCLCIVVGIATISHKDNSYTRRCHALGGTVVTRYSCYRERLYP
jgi:hypothetical protein